MTLNTSFSFVFDATNTPIKRIDRCCEMLEVEDVSGKLSSKNLYVSGNTLTQEAKKKKRTPQFNVAQYSLSTLTNSQQNILLPKLQFNTRRKL